MRYRILEVPDCVLVSSLRAAQERNLCRKISIKRSDAKRLDEDQFCARKDLLGFRTVPIVTQIHGEGRRQVDIDVRSEFEAIGVIIDARKGASKIVDQLRSFPFLSELASNQHGRVRVSPEILRSLVQRSQLRDAIDGPKIGSDERRTFSTKLHRKVGIAQKDQRVFERGIDCRRYLRMLFSQSEEYPQSIARMPFPKRAKGLRHGRVDGITGRLRALDLIVHCHTIADRGQLQYPIGHGWVPQ